MNRRRVNVPPGRWPPRYRPPRWRGRSTRAVPIRIGRRSQLILVLSAIALALGVWREQGGDFAIAGTPEAVAQNQIYVVDGDTIHVGREKVRISNLDAPEMPGRARCEREASLALAAKATLTNALLKPGSQVELERDQVRKIDRYGRTLAHVLVDGHDVADVLIKAGVARPWRGRSSNWCGGERE